MPRSYVVALQKKARDLRIRLAALTENEDEGLDPELLVRGAGLVKMKEGDEPSFLGPSSGIAMTRLVIELAKDLGKLKKVSDLVPDERSRAIREHFGMETSKPSSKSYPDISSVAAPGLPSRELTNCLVENFFKKAQYLYPVLHEPTLRYIVEEVYQGSMDAYKNFTVNLVIALSMQKSGFPGLGDSYYLRALPFLEGAVRPRDLGTLQCFMLICQYSLVTPTRTAATWVTGLATKLCQELRLTDEASITCDEQGKQYDPLEIDLRRRGFWITTNMELGLAHSLGRPNQFGTPYNHIDVRWFQMVDDEYITRQGIIPSPNVSCKKQIARHLMRMRLLQLEIRRTLYLKKRPTPNDDSDPWFNQMWKKLEDWITSVPENSDGTGLDFNWFKGRWNTVVVFLWRPSPQVPQPSLRAARFCFEASRFNIELFQMQTGSQSNDLNWVFTQGLFMAINTILWTLSFPEIRQENPKGEIEELLLAKALETAYYCSLKWPGVEGAMELYGTLTHACLRAYDKADSATAYSETFCNAASPSDSTDSPSPFSSPSFKTESLPSSHLRSSASPTLPSPISPGISVEDNSIYRVAKRNQPPAPVGFEDYSIAQPSPTWRPADPTQFVQDLSAFSQPLPDVSSNAFAPEPQNRFYAPLFNTHFPTVPAAGSYLRYAYQHDSSQPSMIALNVEQQAELMDRLETRKLDIFS